MRKTIRHQKSSLDILLSFLAVITALFSQGQDITVSTSGSVRGSAYAKQNKIVTLERGGELFTYFAFLEEQSPVTAYTVRVLEYNHKDSMSNYVDVGDIQLLNGYPPHGTPSITIDKDGYLHIVYGPHYAEIKYRKSTQSLFNSSLNFSPIVTVGALKSSHDQWTYLTIKSDDSKTLHISGSLDATNPFSDKAQDIGYIRKKINQQWEYPLQTNDPVNSFSPNYEYVRYDVMMNIDNNNKVHILAPDTNASLSLPEWKTDYYYFTSGTGGNSFNSQGLVWEHDLVQSRGRGNIAFDSNDFPHFTINAGNTVLSEYIYHNYYNGQSWTKDAIGLQGKYVHVPKLRIDDYNHLFMSFYATNGSGWTSTGSELYLAFKDLNDSNATIKKYLYRKIPGSLIWIPTIEEFERFTNINKNWFHMMWQESTSHNNNAIQHIYADLVVPTEFAVPVRTYKRHTDFKTGTLLTAGNPNATSQPSLKTTLSETSTANFTSGQRIRLSPGFHIKRGAKFHATIDSGLEGFDKITNLMSKTGLKDEFEESSAEEVSSENQGLLLFPNPNTGVFHIDLPESLISEKVLVQIFDGLGKLVHQEKINASRGTIKTNSLSVGTYYLKVTHKETLFSKKILITN